MRIGSFSDRCKSGRSCTSSGCAGWSAARHFIDITDPPFQSGQTAQLKIYINGATQPPDGPCDANAERQATGEVPIQ